MKDQNKKMYKYNESSGSKTWGTNNFNQNWSNYFFSRNVSFYPALV